MTTFWWAVLLLLVGVAMGRIVGALLSFTRAPVVYDLLAGGLGALAAGVLLRWLGPVSLRAPLLTLLAGVAAALLATWLTRIATWPAEPPLRRPDDMLPDAPAEPRGHDVMTTGEATAMLQTRGRLVAP